VDQGSLPRSVALADPRAGPDGMPPSDAQYPAVWRPGSSGEDGRAGPDRMPPIPMRNPLRIGPGATRKILKLGGLGVCAACSGLLDTGAQVVSRFRSMGRNYLTTSMTSIS